MEHVENIDISIREIDIWKCVTELYFKQQGLPYYLLLPCKIHKTCEDISVTALNSEKGLKVQPDKIKELYAKDHHSLAYIKYNKFESFHRSSDITIVDYLNELEGLYNRIIHRCIRILCAEKCQ